MPHRIQQGVLGIAVLGALLGLVALSRSMTTSGSLVLAPVVLLPYAILGLTSRAAQAELPQGILLAAALIFAGSSYLSLTPSANAQGALIVVVTPVLQGAVALFVYVVLRLLGALSPRVTASGSAVAVHVGITRPARAHPLLPHTRHRHRSSPTPANQFFRLTPACSGLAALAADARR